MRRNLYTTRSPFGIVSNFWLSDWPDSLGSPSMGGEPHQIVLVPYMYPMAHGMVYEPVDFLKRTTGMEDRRGGRSAPSHLGGFQMIMMLRAGDKVWTGRRSPAFLHHALTNHTPTIVYHSPDGQLVVQWLARPGVKARGRRPWCTSCDINHSGPYTYSSRR